MPYLFPTRRALAIRDEVKFFKAVKAQLMKNDDEEEGPKLSKEEMELAIKQIVSDAITSEGVIPLTGTKDLKVGEYKIRTFLFSLMTF